MPNHLINGLTYLTRGAQLIVHPRLRLFVLVPVLINFVLFVIITSLLVAQFGSALHWLLDWLPSWMDWLAWILWLLFAIVLLLVYGYSFSMITNIIAAPFYGVLAERTELLLTGKAPDSEPLMKMIPRTLGREMVKLWYFIVRGVAILLITLVLSWIPVVNVLAPVIVFIWGAWSMAIQYADYAADNHQTPFAKMRDQLSASKYSSVGFGGLVMLGTMVPLANVIVLPIAVVGGTVFWLEELKGRA